MVDNYTTLGPLPKKLLCCPLPTDRKMRKNRVGFFLFCSQHCWKCQIWAKNLLKFVFNVPKKALVYMRFDCIPPEFFPHLETCRKKNIGKLNSLTVRKLFILFLLTCILSTLTCWKKKKKKKKIDRPTHPIFKFWSGEGNITFFFFWPYGHNLNIMCIWPASLCKVAAIYTS